MKIKILVALLTGFALIGVCGTAFATSVVFDDFSDTSIMTLSGNAFVASTDVGKVLRLTSSIRNQRGSAFVTQPINASTFSAHFTFRITNPGGGGADGLVFVVQNVNASIGGSGGGMGFSGVQPSVGVEFDTWYNSSVHDPSSNHVGIDVNGNIDHGAGAPFTVNITPNFDDENIWHAWIDYNGVTLEARVNQNGIRPIDSVLSRNLDIQTILGTNTAYVGFTSGTGAATGNHEVLTWEYRDSYNPIDACNLFAIESFAGSDTTINPLPLAGQTVGLSAAISNVYGSNASWTLFVDGQSVQEGSGTTVNIGWDARNAEDSIVTGIHEIRMDAYTADGLCSAEKVIPVSVEWTDDCKLDVTFP